MRHTEQHPLSGKTVKIVKGSYAGNEYRVEDWTDRLWDTPWFTKLGNPACLQAIVRQSQDKFPVDEETVYGKIGGLGHIIHISELEN